MYATLLYFVLEEIRLKDSLKPALLFGTLFGLGIGLFSCLTKGVLNGVKTGIIMGAFSGLLIWGFEFFQSKIFKKNSQKIVGNETIVFEGGANHFKGTEAVGGWLYLTNKKLIFQSHNYNVQNHKLVIPLNQITSIRTSLTHGYMPTGLQVVTNDGVEKFVVFKRKEWVRRISENIKSEAAPSD